MAEPKYYDELPTYIMHSDGEFKEGVFKAVDGSGNSFTIETEKGDTEGKLTIEGADKAEFDTIFEINERPAGTSKNAGFTATIGEIVFQMVASVMSVGAQAIEGLAVTFKKGNNTINFSLPSLATLEEFMSAITTRVEQLLPKNINDGTGTGAVVEGLIGTDVPAESRNEASGANAHAEGGYIFVSNGGETVYLKSVASGASSHAEGRGQATAELSHAEAVGIASGEYSHAEGFSTASAQYSHAQNYSAQANGFCSHAEGNLAHANGRVSHAEGQSSTADGDNSHSQNERTIAQGKSQTVIGRNNVAQGTANSYVDTDYAFIIGNGTSNSDRSNALAVRWDGAIVLANGTVLTVEQLAKVANLT